MNRIVGYFALDGSTVKSEIFNSCQFNTPHWQPDHQAIYLENSIAFSATQRFITPECHSGLMPHQNNITCCVINADVYLTNREILCDLLNIDIQTSDAVLILQAYLKWGEDCTHYLAGNFCFMIWDPRHQHLFAAVDQFAQCPLFYVYRPGEFLIMANECSSFHVLCPQLTLDPNHFIEFANDIHSTTNTAYKEICKLPSGHQLVVNAKTLRQTCYWRWKDHKQILPYKTHQEYYEVLKEYFEKAVQKCLRRLGTLTTQISGVLDSSAVTAQSAILVAKEYQTLSAFTSIPNNLTGESYRSGWYYHELSRIDELLIKYPNIQHTIYTANPSTNIFEKLKPLQLCFDRPLRNINNIDWTIGCYEHVLAQQGRILLIGAGGNSTISWDGVAILESLKTLYIALKAKLLFRPYRFIPNLHKAMLSGQLTAPLRASIYVLQLWYGVRRLDPTQELDLTIFCYNVPNFIYRSGNNTLQKRLLVREGLNSILPDAITKNPYRGEQGADWYLHYNQHCQNWRDKLLGLTESAQAILWKSYDRKKIMDLFDEYHYLDQPPDRKVTRDLCNQLFRCLSAGFYLSKT